MAGGGRRSPHARDRGGGGGEKGKHHGGSAREDGGGGKAGSTAGGASRGGGCGTQRGVLVAAIQAKLGGDGLGDKLAEGGGGCSHDQVSRVLRSAGSAAVDAQLGVGSVRVTPDPAVGGGVEENAVVVAPRCHPKCFYGICTFNQAEEEDSAGEGDSDSHISGECPCEDMVLGDGFGTGEAAAGLSLDREPNGAGELLSSGDCGWNKGGAAPSALRQGLNAPLASAASLPSCPPGACGIAPPAFRPFWEPPLASAPGKDLRPPSARQMAPEGSAGQLPGRGNVAGNRKPKPWSSPILVPFDTVEDRAEISLDDNTLVMDVAAVDCNIARLDKALVGRLLGKKVPYMFLNGELQRRWGHLGSFQTMMISDECFMCTFELMEARDAVLTGGPWLIAGCLLGLLKWKPDFNPDSWKGFSTPVWVHLPSLPLSCWDKKNIGRFAAMIGEPLWIDANTDRRTRCTYARFCVRHDLSEPLPDGIWVDVKGSRYYQRFEYEGIAALCFKCGRVGHKVGSCPLAPKDMPGTRVSPSPEGGAGPSLSSSQAPAVNLPLRPTPLTAASPSAGQPSVSSSPPATKGHGPWNLVVNKRNAKAAKAAANAGQRLGTPAKLQPDRGKKPIVNESVTGGRISSPSQTVRLPVSDISQPFCFSAPAAAGPISSGVSGTIIGLPSAAPPSGPAVIRCGESGVDDPLAMVVFTASSGSEGKRKRKKSKSGSVGGGDASSLVDL